jgi:hypothetical protein
MHKFTKIYLDMDGVIADFAKRYKELHKISPEEADKKKQFGKFFDEFIKSGQFATLDLMPDAKELLSHLKTTDVPVEILSSTARQDSHVAISRQKTIWLDRHGINYTANFVPGKSLKYKFATPESIIIDDTQSVIDDWRKAGGIGIHHKDALTTITMLRTLLAGV